MSTPEQDVPETDEPTETQPPVTEHKPVLMKAPYDPDEEEEPAVCCSNPAHQHR